MELESLLWRRTLGAEMSGPVTVHTDASAAIGISNRVGTGKVRHIEVNQLWVQEKIAKGELKVIKVGTDENLADALTKAVSADAIGKHLSGLSCEWRVDRHELAPSIESKSVV